MTTCSIEDCETPVAARGWCRKHYARWYTKGSTADPLPPALCAVPGCGRVVRARKVCVTHHQRLMKHGDVLAHIPVAVVLKGGPICAVEGCDIGSRTAVYCKMHTRRLKRLGVTGEAERRIAPRGQRRNVDDNGYVVVSGSRRPGGSKNGGVLEHRKIMEDLIGRPLRADENVHHKNGVRDDNRPENLELWTTSQPSGQRVADKVQWAREILDRYADLALV